METRQEGDSKLANDLAVGAMAEESEDFGLRVLPHIAGGPIGKGHEHATGVMASKAADKERSRGILGLRLGCRILRLRKRFGCLDLAGIAQRIART